MISNVEGLRRIKEYILEVICNEKSGVMTILRSDPSGFDLAAKFVKMFNELSGGENYTLELSA
jgi:hypothetical protein